MKSNFPNRNHWRVYYFLRFGALVLFSAMPAQGALFQRSPIPPPVAKAPQPQRPAVLKIRIDEGRITATIAESPLQKVLEDLAARTGVVFEIRSQDNPLVSVNLSRVSLQEAIQRIAPANNVIYLYNQDRAEPERITLVRLFPRIDNSPQPSILYLGTGSVTKGNDPEEAQEQ